MSFQIPKPQNIIDLGVGQPDPELLPSALFQSLSINPEHLAYGEQAGDGAFRCSLASWLSGECGQPVCAERLMITNGNSNALDMICQRFAQPGDTVLVEDPSYFIALKLFAEHGLIVVAVPMDEHGIDLNAVEQALQQHNPAFIYTIPTCHNPTGITQPDSRRQQLVALAKRHECLLVSDEVYQHLTFTEQPAPSLASYDADAPVLAIGSFSKILAPGLRLGWIYGTADLLPRLVSSALLNSGGGLAPVQSALVGQLLERGEFQNYLATIRQIYQSRMSVLHDGLQTVFGGRVQINLPIGGYFLWVTFVDGTDVMARLDAANSAGVNYFAGSLFSGNGSFRTSMRLCFAWYGERELEQACRRLAKVFL